MRRILRFIDWRFIFAVALLIIVLLVGHSYWDAHRESQAKDAQVHHLIVAHDKERADASRERAELLAGQRRLEARYEDLARTNRALVAWLQSRGIRVPSSLIAEKVDVDGDGRDDSDDIDREADEREQAARPKARPPGSGGGSSNGGGGGGGSDNGADKSDRGNGHGRDKDDRGNGKDRDKGGRGNGRGRG